MRIPLTKAQHALLVNLEKAHETAATQFKHLQQLAALMAQQADATQAALNGFISQVAVDGGAREGNKPAGVSFGEDADGRYLLLRFDPVPLESPNASVE